MDWLTNPEVWAALLALTAMEIVLGIDNIVFLAILVDRLPAARRASARRIGLGLALIARLALLTGITTIMRLTQPVFEVAGQAFSWRDIILIAGGLFLVWKGTTEIHGRIEGEGAHQTRDTGAASFGGIIVQIVLIDLVFSIDSVITAIGMANQLWIMMAAVVISIGVMFAAAGAVAGFIERHPTVRMLALSFLLLIGTMLVADGFGAHISRGYIYAAMGFSILVEMLNRLAAARGAVRRR
jgi:predicted tellurium resistance membrane protein TerC